VSPGTSVPPDANVPPAAIVDPGSKVESGPVVDPDVNGAPETAVEPDAVEPGTFVEIIVGAESEMAVLTAGGRLSRGGGATGVSDGRFSRRPSSARAPGCAESSAIASTANRRAASRDPL
jgi:hypothetical protein